MFVMLNIVLYVAALLVLFDHLTIHPKVNQLFPPFDEIIAPFIWLVGQVVIQYVVLYLYDSLSGFLTNLPYHVLMWLLIGSFLSLWLVLPPMLFIVVLLVWSFSLLLCVLSCDLLCVVFVIVIVIWFFIICVFVLVLLFIMF